MGGLRPTAARNCSRRSLLARPAAQAFEHLADLGLHDAFCDLWQRLACHLLDLCLHGALDDDLELFADLLRVASSLGAKL